MKHRALFLVGLFTVAVLAGLLAGILAFSGGRQGATAVPGSQLVPPEVPTQTEFQGIVRTISGPAPAEWLVGDVTVRVLPSTTVITNGLTIEPGIWARVEGMKIPNTGIRAITINLQENPRVNLLDRIIRMDGSGLWQVGNTQVVIPEGLPIGGDEPPAVGLLALVRGIASLEGVVADAIDIIVGDNEVAFEGRIEVIDGPTWQVDGVTVLVDPSTILVGEPEVGKQAQVLGLKLSPGVVQAVFIEVAADFASHELAGWLISIQGDGFPYRWRVQLLGGPTLQPALLLVDADTVVDTTASPALPGAWLDITARREDETVYRAERIVVLNHAPKQVIVGIVEHMPATGLYGLWRVSDYQLTVDEETAVLGAPEVGDLVWIAAVPDHTNLYQAEIVQVIGE